MCARAGRGACALRSAIKIKMQNELRELQDEFANSGWRIKQISYAPDGKPVVVGFENWPGYVAVFSMFGFLIGIGLAFYLHNSILIFYISIPSLLISFAAVATKNLLIKKGWMFIDARCVDREVRKGTGRNGTIWASRILCEFDHDGTLIQCTPSVHWSTWRSEVSAQQFLNSKIDPNGGCTLRVNPKNLREANLSDRRIK